MNTQLTPCFPTRILKASQGLSLIELLISLSIISLLLFVGLPSFTNSLRNNQAESATQDLFTAIQTTRTLAVMQHKRAVLKANDEWKGWELFVDDNDNGARDENEALLFMQNELDHLSITSTKAMKTISFINTGESRQANGSIGGAFLAGNIRVCAKKHQKGYKLILARGGRTRISSIICN